ncbi:hypothetical protein UPYG_G00204800 [Umbra pygmaea]|uniref:Leucine-, glutamate- and lysine-rich protein 1 n=1 Tax=Umbra pygmaea TaxID=75934 RepID=A0ABD0WIZ3_UMBPY
MKRKEKSSTERMKCVMYITNAIGKRQWDAMDQQENGLGLMYGPFYPLPEGIQQMDRSETVCQYCGVSYLILHEFQLLQERLAQLERELQNQRGSAETERAQRVLLEQGRAEWESALREELQRGATEQQTAWKEELETRTKALRKEVERQEAEKAQTQKQELVKRSEERERDLRQQLERSSEERCRILKEEYENRSKEREKILKQDLQLAIGHLEEKRKHLGLLEERGMCAGQRQALSATLSLLHYSRKELRDVQGFLQQLTVAWEDFRSQLLERNKETFSDLTEELSNVYSELQRIKTEKDRVVQLLTAQSRQTEELVNQQSRTESEQRDKIFRLTQQLRDKEEEGLSCRRTCDSLQSQVLAWQQREEEVSRKCSGAEQEVGVLRKELEHARQESAVLRRESEQMIDAHRKTLSKMEENFRQELCLKLEAALEEQRSQNAVQMKEQEEELKKEAGLELEIDREKSREMLLQYQRENEQLQVKLCSQVLSDTQELRDQVESLERRLRELEEEAERSSATEQGLQHALQHSQQQGALELNQARTELQLLKKDNIALQEEVVLLQETVRKECEERGELTAALTHAKEQLLGIHPPSSPLGFPNLPGKLANIQAYPPHPQTKSRLSLTHTRTLTPQQSLRPSPPHSDAGLREGGGDGRIVASWHGSEVAGTGGGRGRARGGSLPKLRSSAVSDVKHRVNLVMGRKKLS